MRELIDELATRVAAHAGAEAAEIARLVTVPPQPELGDFCLPCFTLARSLGRSPAAIATELASLSWQELPWVAYATATGPYLNWKLSVPEYARVVLAAVERAGEQFGTSTMGRGQSVVVDYSSPNIAKQLAVHHLRSTMLGHALVNLFRACGYEVIGVNHLGDWGTSFGQLMTGWDLFAEEEGLNRVPLERQDDPIGLLTRLYTRFHESARAQPDLEERARDWFRRLEAGDTEARRRWQAIRDVSLSRFERVYQRLGVRFEEVIGESFFEDRMAPVIEELQRKGLLEESDAALVVRLDEPELPPMLIRKTDGSTLYGTRDLAAADYRWQRWHFARCLYVVDAGQRLHFRQMFGVLKRLGREYADRLEHTEFGVMRLSVEGQWVKGRTRHGKVVLLEDVLDAARDAALEAMRAKGGGLDDPERVAEAVGIAAVVFADLKARRIKDVNFDLEQMTSFEGETGPYLQYTHVRFCGILRNAKPAAQAAADGSRLDKPEELALLREIARLREVLERAAVEAEPSILSQYLLGLASCFNTYYAQHRVLSEDVDLTAHRLRLVDALRVVLARGLRILGIEPLEQM